MEKGRFLKTLEKCIKNLNFRNTINMISKKERFDQKFYQNIEFSKKNIFHII